jgi:hypothetical protein
MELFEALIQRFPGGVSSIVDQVVWDFLDRTAVDAAPGRHSKPGVQWDNVFLPDGTEIRTKYFHQFKIATIEGSAIVWEGKEYSSMSRLARAMRNDTSNNAWQVLYIKRPTDQQWKLADSLRR